MEEEKKTTSPTIKGEGFEFSPETDKIIPAFIEFQSSLNFASKGAENPFYKSKYSTLTDMWEAIRKPLKENKLAIMWFPTTLPFSEIMLKEYILRNNNGYEKRIWSGKWIKVMVREVMVTTMLLHGSGQHVKTWIIMSPDDNDNQSKGISMTYGKRYGASSLCGVNSEEDNDGNQTPKQDNGKKKDPPPPSPPKPPKPPKPPVDKWKVIGGVHRWNETKKCFNEAFQKKNGLIDSLQWRKIKELINKKLNSDMNVFGKWLEVNHNCKFYDITNKMLPGIITCIDCTPNEIVDSVAE